MTDLNTTIPSSIYLSRSLQLANSSTVVTSPNPSVGAVIVAKNRIIGEGHTQEDGGPHAEVMALNDVSQLDAQLLKEATLFVSLEPCSIFGRTPPCCDLIIKHQLKKVVVGCIDFTPGVLGKGLERMRNAGIEVKIGVEQDLAFEYSKYRQAITRKNRPYVILKQAISQDGFVGIPNQQLLLTGKMANTLSHQWRSQVDAILVGANTVQVDDPSLSTRLAPGRSPARVILDPKGRVELSKQVFAKAERKELTTYWAVDSAIAKTCEANVKSNNLSNIVVLSLDASNRIESLLTALLELRIGRILVEGGPTTLSHFVEANAYDEYRQWTSPVRAGHHPDATKAALVPGENAQSYSIGNDKLVITRNP